MTNATNQIQVQVSVTPIQTQPIQGDSATMIILAIAVLMKTILTNGRR